MSDELDIGKMPPEKSRHDLEMIITAFLPNLKHIENRFDQLTLDIRELRVDLKDVSNRVSALEKRMDKFEVLVDQRFDQLSTDLRDFKGDVNRRFEQVDNRFEQIDKRFELVDKRFEQIDKRFELIDKRFEQIEARFNQIDRRFENVDRRFDQIAASIERLGDKIDARDARQRSFTLRMFSIAISISFLGALGVLIKVFSLAP